MKKIIKEHGLWLAILMLMTAIAYHNGFSGEFISDDTSLLVDKNLGDLQYILFNRPFPVLGLMRYFSFRLGGLQPFSFHLVNIFIHLANVYLVYLLINFLSAKNRKLAFFTASLFAVHPILTEAVTWISGASYLLYTLFLLGSLLMFIAYTLYKRSLKYYLGSLTLFLLAMLSSLKAAIFPLILIMYYLVYLPKKKGWRLLIPYGLITIVSVLFSVTSDIGSRLQEAQIGQGAHFINLFLPPVSLATYLRLFIWPDRLTLHHVDPVITWHYIMSFVLLFCIAGMVVVFWKKNKQLFFWSMFFLISLSLVFTPFPLASFVAERYVYLGSIGIFYLFARLLILIGKKLRTDSISLIFFIFIMMLLTARTIERNDDWKTKKSFWSSTIATSAFSYQAHNNYGLILLDEGKKQEAVSEFGKTVLLKPDYAEGHQNLGYAHQLLGRLAEALDEYRTALDLYQKTTGPKPNLGKLYQNLGGLYLSINQYDDALPYAQKALELDSHNPDLITNIGIIYLKKGERDNAKKAFMSALTIDPNFKKAQYWMKQ